MKKNKVMISGKDGEQFEVEFRRFSKRVIVTCVKVKGLNFHGAIEAFVKKLNLVTVDDDGIMEIVYYCKDEKEFKNMLRKLSS